MRRSAFSLELLSADEMVIERKVVVTLAWTEANFYGVFIP